MNLIDFNETLLSHLCVLININNIIASYCQSGSQLLCYAIYRYYTYLLIFLKCQTYEYNHEINMYVY